MSTTNNWRRPSNKSLLTIFTTMLVCIVALIYFFPRESKFGYDYELNKPWRYQQLIASYDFPIYKTEAEIKRERDSVMHGFLPYFTLDTQAGEKNVRALRDDFYAGKFKGLPGYYLPRLVELFQQVYGEGIIDAEELERLQAASTPGLRVVQGQESTNMAVASLRTTRSAYAYIMARDSGSVPYAVLQACNLNNYLTPNLKIDRQKTRLAREGELAKLIPYSGMVQSGQLIIDRGQIVNAEHVKILDSLKKESERRMDPSRGFWLVFTGQAASVLVILSLLFFYLKLFRRDYLHSPHTILLLYSLVTFFPIVTYLMMEHHFYSVYLVPYTIVPIFARIFMDSRTAFVALVTSSLLSALSLHSPFEFILWQTVTGLTAIYTLRELTERSQLLRTVAAVVAAGLVVSVCYDMSQGLNWEAFDRSRTVYIIISGGLMLFAYPLMYLVERLFGFTSSVTLVELTNINNPILRKMSKVAQGTFNHSMQVANLAAEVADKIGAKPQLVRTGALYHDIGKMLNPAFFTENQNGVNPHDSLSEERSAQIIIGHVTEGLRLAEKYHLPSIIRDFIATHHGKGLVKYFYIQYCNKHPGEETDRKLFSYPGPNPWTREQAILMMCDAVEAASRSLKEYTEESIRALVDRIVDGQLADGCFRECPITFRDIADAKRVLVDSLKTVYHTRIAYPEMKKEQTAEDPRPGLFGKGLHLPRRH